LLKFLSIQNIVLIDKAIINFGSGLCVLTGETGSTKSILLNALGLAIGFRSNLRLIGNDENKAQVVAEFDISQNLNCQQLLAENELFDVENPNLVRIRRSIQENSSSKAFVNDVAIGITLLAKIGESLIEIHGQHDQRGLLNSTAHGEILDEFAQNENLLKELRKKYDLLRETEDKIAAINAKKEEIKREKDYLKHVINELENADVKPNEEEELISKKDQLIGKERILNFLSELKSKITEANSQLVLSQRIIIRGSNVIDNFLSEKKDEFENLSEKLDQQNIDLDSALTRFDSIIRDIKNSENNLEEIEERLFLIRSLARKFNVRTEELGAIVVDSKAKLKLLNFEEEMGLELEKTRLNLAEEYQKIADELSQRRKKSALILATKVEEELQFLKMENTKFLVELKNSDDASQRSAKGHDKVRFLSSINKNSFDNISKIASGGELSRFMLALKVALMNVRSVPTMIFDEIDTGIGGSTADAVGKRLKILSKHLQILVVTHQPQIAAKADNHFKISKTSDSHKIKTLIETLNNDGSEVEIARMLSGEIVSPEALAAASRLISDS
jgi:DNA repair protein RecN (Recombination protein N)